MCGKPIITATQMLESMVNNPRPTRAESADVINAVLDGSDCVMLSGETAGGKFPVECVKIMAKLCFEAENCLSTRDLMAESLLLNSSQFTVQESIARSAVFLSIDIEAKMILVFTQTGRASRLVSKYRPRCLILSLSEDIHVVKSLSISRAVISVLVDSLEDTDKNVERAINHAKLRDMLRKDDLIVVVHGARENVSGSSDLIKVVKIP